MEPVHIFFNERDGDGLDGSLNYVWEGRKRAKRFKVVHLEGKNIFVFWDESY